MTRRVYSFRRCPYAIRARLALATAGFRPGETLEVREVSLKAKPAELLAASSKGTVPVLVVQSPGCPDLVLDESLAIMHWALAQRDPEAWWVGRPAAEQHTISALITQNDGPFKHHLDRFKYAGRYGALGLSEQSLHRSAALAILRQWNQQLAAGGWLLGERPSLADMALLPFVRQFRLADPPGFDSAADLGALQGWLGRFLGSSQLAVVLDDGWAPRSPWRSPSWLYHLALSDAWQRAQREGTYTHSTRGQSLAEVGFIHLSQAHQVEATARRFYNDLPAGSLTLLCIDPKQLQQQGLEVRLESPDPRVHHDGPGERFPHLYGALPVEAVVHSETFVNS